MTFMIFYFPLSLIIKPLEVCLSSVQLPNLPVLSINFLFPASHAVSKLAALAQALIT